MKCFRRSLSLGLVVVSLVFGWAPGRAAGETVELGRWLAYLERLIPSNPQQFTPALPDEVAKAAAAIDDWAFIASQAEIPAAGPAALAEELLVAKDRSDRLLDRAFELRVKFAALADPGRRDAIRSYLRVTARLIDLSGRLRYLLSDALAELIDVAANEAEQARLLDVFAAHRSSIAAHVCANRWLERPAPGVRTSPLFEEKAIGLIAASGQSALLPALVRVLERNQLAPSTCLAATRAIRELGLPQDARPGSPTDTPAPPVTARAVLGHLARHASGNLPAELARQRGELTSWLDERATHGLGESRLRLGGFDVEPGDWLLMRNPSPYNLFTDLSPGLFSHVGVVAEEQGKDGIRRMVLVDLQERGARMAATSVELFVQRSLHYVFLRHPDAKTARAMGEAARSVIGNPTEFDLNFRTERVLELAHQPLAGRKINTYCAGLLLLCALQTDRPRDEFFPMSEFAAGGHTVENLARLGMSFGRDFISPTGSLFSTHLEIVGRREPMYDPRRQVEEAVFDHFADCLVRKKLAPAIDLFDSLRLKVAEAARSNPALERALARAAGVSSDTDMVGAARGAAVVETLDEVAFSTSAEFVKAREALRAPPAAAGRRASAEAQTTSRLQQRHSALYAQVQRGTVSPRDVRIALVDEYIRRGRQEIERRFFAGPAKAN